MGVMARGKREGAAAMQQGKYLASITQDLISDGASRVGDEFWSDAGRPSLADVAEMPAHTFKLYDDDGELYYVGIISADEDGLDAGIERLYEWGAYDAGTTEIRVDGERWM